MLLNGVKIKKSLINSFYTPLLFTFNFLHPLSPFLFFLFIILLNIPPANSLFFKGISIQLNIFKIDNMFFILILTAYTCL